MQIEITQKQKGHRHASFIGELHNFNPYNIEIIFLTSTLQRLEGNDVFCKGFEYRIDSIAAIGGQSVMIKMELKASEMIRIFKREFVDLLDFKDEKQKEQYLSELLKD